jgi:alanyl-tRNA synthetase
VTGEAALELLRGRDEALARVESSLGVEPGRALEEVESLRRDLKERDAELARLRLQLVSGAAGAKPADEPREVAGVRLLVREVPPAPAGELRNLADLLRDRLGSGVVVLGARGEGRVSLVATVTEDLRGRVPAGRLLREVAAVVGGSGGGRDDFAQAGGKLPDRLPEALASVAGWVERWAGGASGAT